MKRLSFLLLGLFFNCILLAQTTTINHPEIKADLHAMIESLRNNYAFLSNKKVDLSCIQEYYEEQISQLKTYEDTVLFFEYLLDEFYDSHLILTTNTNASYRLYAPIYATLKKNDFYITNVWSTQIVNLSQNIVDAEILKFNTIDFNKAIDNFPTHCNDKSVPEVREWISNKILAGRYNEPRIVTLQLKTGEITTIDLDKLSFKKGNGLLNTQITNENIGIIRINNSLGRDELVNAFDTALDSLMNTKTLILDLRNTVDGGDSYEARGIMGRFISEPKPYQRHEFVEKAYDNPEANPKITRSWMEYVTPRGLTYTKPVVVLVGRWTGSMGEGLAIGFEGIGRAPVMGSEMERLAGEIWVHSFNHRNFSYRVPYARLYHVNGTPREKYVPSHYVQQTTTEKDEVLERALQFFEKE